MTLPTPWAPASNGQTAGLPAVKRYLQLMVTLTTFDVLTTPVLNNISIDYNKPVKLVEVSVDDQVTWSPATGTGKWHALMTLSEDTTRIWVKVTDVAGDVNLGVTNINVDTTPPEGAILINDGETFAVSEDVVITLNANDKYGVSSVIMSEDPDFFDASWAGYQASIPFVLSSGDGNKTVYAKFRDVHGWESKIVNDSIILDTIPPKGSILINGGANFTRNTTIALAMNVTDLEGVTEMKISDFKDLHDADWQPFKTVLSWVLPPGNGERAVYVIFRSAAGQESNTATASIILDTQGPATQVSINGGAAYTNSNLVSLHLNATDNYRMGAMEIGNDPTFSGSAWEPFSGGRSWTLSPGDGLKKVYARAADVAGNEGTAGVASIVLDTTAPSSEISPLPFTVNMTNFTVGWNGSDATSGILLFDVQYNDSGGAWTDWHIRTNSTKADFSGADGHTYSFRVRAQDRAGNLENHTDAPGNAVLVRVPVPRLPVVTIMRPVANTTVKGITYVTGTSYHLEPGMKVQSVLIQLDGGAQQQAEGTDSWMYKVDTAGLVNGRHTVRAQAFDGHRYSNVTVTAFLVNNQPSLPAAGLLNDQFPWLVLVIIIVAVAGFAAYMKMKRQRSPAAQVPPVGSRAEGPTARPGGPAERPLPSPPLVPPAEGTAPPAVTAPEKMAVMSKISVDELEEPEAPPAPGKSAAQKLEDETAAKEGRILKALTSLPRGLPSSLWGMDMDELAANVASAEEKTSEQGDRLVKIGSRWYFGDERNLGLFMQEYKK